MSRVIDTTRKAKPLRTARAREFRELAQTPAMRAVAARCSTQPPRHDSAAPDSTQEGQRA